MNDQYPSGKPDDSDPLDNNVDRMLESIFASEDVTDDSGDDFEGFYEQLEERLAEKEVLVADKVQGLILLKLGLDGATPNDDQDPNYGDLDDLMTATLLVKYFDGKDYVARQEILRRQEAELDSSDPEDLSDIEALNRVYECHYHLNKIANHIILDPTLDDDLPGGIHGVQAKIIDDAVINPETKTVLMDTIREFMPEDALSSGVDDMQPMLEAIAAQQEEDRMKDRLRDVSDQVVTKFVQTINEHVANTDLHSLPFVDNMGSILRLQVRDIVMRNAEHVIDINTAYILRLMPNDKAEKVYLKDTQQAFQDYLGMSSEQVRAIMESAVDIDNLGIKIVDSRDNPDGTSNESF